MNTNVESLVFSMMTFSATLPGAAKTKRLIYRQDLTSTQQTTRTETSRPARTGSNHRDGRLDVDPFICVNTRVDEYEAVKVRLLTASQGVLDGVVVLEDTRHIGLISGVDVGNKINNSG